METDFFIFNGVIFRNKDKVRVTYCSNLILLNTVFFHTYQYEETVEISDNGIYLCFEEDGIVYKRALHDLRYNNLIFNIEKLCN